LLPIGGFAPWGSEFHICHKSQNENGLYAAFGAKRTQSATLLHLFFYTFGEIGDKIKMILVDFFINDSKDMLRKIITKFLQIH